MTRKELKELKESDILVENENYDLTYTVEHIYKSGISAYTSWRNCIGTFIEDKFVRNEELLTNSWSTISREE